MCVKTFWPCHLEKDKSTHLNQFTAAFNNVGCFFADDCNSHYWIILHCKVLIVIYFL